MSTLKTTNLQHASAASPAIVLDANSRATLNGLSYPTEGSLSGRNRIINGDMRIDQRNAGASISNGSGANAGFVVDRWNLYGSQASKLTGQQNAGSVTPPAGFKNYAGITSSSAYSVLTGDYFSLYHRVEGFNTADLEWGTANASSITLSFWVRSSLTGTFGGALSNNAFNRSYPFTYTISAANTWEKKTLTIAGDTTGTWATDNNIGISVYFGLGAGSTYSGTAGAWTGSGLFSATGATSVVGTNGATFYITGVQLEAGSTATPFERRSYGQELALCQRYYWKTYDTNTAPGTVANNGVVFGIANGNINRPIVNIFFPVSLRAVPTTTFYSSGTGASGKVRDLTAAADYDGAVFYSGTTNLSWYPSATPANNNGIAAHVTVSAEL